MSARYALYTVAGAFGILGCVVLLAACGGDDNGADEPIEAEDPAQEVPAEQPAEATPPDLAATGSGIEGVPIPDSAEPSPDLASGDDGAWTVPGVSYLGLVAWYEERMPEGQDFDRWYWCDTGGGEGVSDDETVHSHIYARGARDILAVSIVNDDPVGLLIGADESGPC